MCGFNGYRHAVKISMINEVKVICMYTALLFLMLVKKINMTYIIIIYAYDQVAY